MLYIYRFDVSEGIDINQTSASKEWDIVIYGISWTIVLSPNQMVKGSDYCCITNLINKNEAINLMQNADFTK